MTDRKKRKKKREKSSQRGAPMNMTVDDNECAQNLSHECAMCIINRNCEQCAICADSMQFVRHAIVEVNVVMVYLCMLSCLLYASFQSLFVML